MFTDVNAFIAELDKRGELARIGEPVDPKLEMAALIDKVSKTEGGGPGLLFERPGGLLDAGRREHLWVDVAHLPGAWREAP